MIRGHKDPRINSVELGNFRLQRVLGQGGYATAYLAEQLGTDRLAVLKIAHRHLIDGQTSEEVRFRFAAEVRAATRANHPNLVTIYTAGHTSDGLPAIAMEYIKGKTLEEIFRAHAPLSRPIIELMFTQIVSAVQAVHEAGIVHRDLKPANIMLMSNSHDSSLQIKVLDFGIAKVHGLVSHTLGPVGTPRYLSPEQIRGNATPQSDIFSIGAMLWWALSGKEYLGHLKNLVDILEHQRNLSVPPNIRQIHPNIPHNIAQFVAELLSPDPQHRPTTREFLERWPSFGIGTPQHLTQTRPSLPPVVEGPEDFPEVGDVLSALVQTWQDPSPTRTPSPISLKANAPARRQSGNLEHPPSQVSTYSEDKKTKETKSLAPGEYPDEFTHKNQGHRKLAATQIRPIESEYKSYQRLIALSGETLEKEGPKKPLKKFTSSRDFKSSFQTPNPSNSISPSFESQPSSSLFQNQRPITNSLPAPNPATRTSPVGYSSLQHISASLPPRGFGSFPPLSGQRVGSVSLPPRGFGSLSGSHSLQMLLNQVEESILVLNDRPALQSLIDDRLGSLGSELVCAQSAKHASIYLRSLNIDVIVIIQPFQGQSSSRIIRWVRQRLTQKTPPAIVLLVGDRDEVERWSMQQTDVVLRFPRDLNIFKNSVGSLLGSSKRGTLLPPSLNLEGFDLSTLKYLMARFPERFERRVENFIGQAPNWLIQIAEAIENRQITEATEQCLELEMTALGVGILSLSEIAASIREWLGAGRFNEAQQQAEHLESTYFAIFKILVTLRKWSQKQ